MKRLLAFLLNLSLFFFPLTPGASAAMGSASFQIPWDGMGDGGGEAGTSTNFTANDTLGLQGTGYGTSTNYQLSAGYRVIETAPTLSLFVRSQDTSTQVSYSAFSNGGKTVTVSSATSYAVGDTIAVIEDVGFGQLVAIGKITNIAGLIITVDAWSGDNASLSIGPAGGNDFVYRQSLSSISYGTAIAGTENTGTVVSSVIADTPNGFTVYTQANQDFQNGSAQPITNVTDGAVTVGVEEYGAEVTGPTAYGSGDLAVTTTQRIIQTKGSQTLTAPDRVAMIYKLSVTSSTNSGSYSQSVFYTLTANY